MAAPTRKKIFDLQGESFETKSGRSRQKVIQNVAPGDRVGLHREPDNAFDENAILVIWQNEDIGYISRDDAKVLAPALDGGRVYAAQVHELVGGIPDYPSHGVRVSIAWDGLPLPPFRPLDDEQEESRSAISPSGSASDVFAKAAFATASGKGGCTSALLLGALLGVATSQFFA